MARIDLDMVLSSSELARLDAPCSCWAYEQVHKMA